MVKIRKTNRPNAFLHGYASAFNYMGGGVPSRRFRYFGNGFDRDRNALANDLRRVGNDMRNAVRVVIEKGTSHREPRASRRRYGWCV